MVSLEGIHLCFGNKIKFIPLLAFWDNDHLCIRPDTVSVKYYFEKLASFLFLQFGFNRLKKIQNFVGKFLKNNQNLHGGDQKTYQGAWKKQKQKQKTKTNNQKKPLKIERWVIFTHNACHLQLSISQNKLVWLVPCLAAKYWARTHIFI